MDWNVASAVAAITATGVSVLALSRTMKKEDTESVHQRTQNELGLALMRAKEEIINVISMKLDVFVRSDVIDERLRAMDQIFKAQLQSIDHRVTKTNDILTQMLTMLMSEHKMVMTQWNEQTDEANRRS
jgi:hypothetical protein